MNILEEDTDVGVKPRSPRSRPLRACMVSYSIYDSDNRVRRYAETLVKHGYRVDAVALRRDEQRVSNNVINGVSVFRVQSRVKNEKSRFHYLAKLILFFLRSLFFLTREQMKEPYDLIHVHSVPDFEVFAALYPKIMGSRVILDIHDIVPEFYASKFKVSQKSLVFKSLVAMERLSAAFSDHVIASNHIWQKRLQGRSVAESKVTTILNFPDTQVFRLKGRNRNDGKFILLYPGTLNYHQGLDIAIRAFSGVKDVVPKAEFHIYGSGDQSEFLKSLVGELGLESRVFFKGSLAVEQMVRVIENADLGIVPKRKNGFGNEAFSTKILEFMAMGVPVIVPDTDIDMYYFDDSVAKFFRANEEKSLAEAMLLLIENPEVREKLIRNASAFVKKYTWDVNEHVYLGLVDSLLNPRNDRGPASILENVN
jgi:glycosyltransferase involved in cell wall biosynthesis